MQISLPVSFAFRHAPINIDALKRTGKINNLFYV
jgi:hypothetical protein